MAWFGTYPGRGGFGTERADVRIGPHRFFGDLVDYRIFIDAAATGGLGLDLSLHATVAPWRPASGIVADGGSFFAWLAVVPEGIVEGTMAADGFVVSFPVSEPLITSIDLLEGQSPLLVGFARAFGPKPCYTR